MRGRRDRNQRARKRGKRLQEGRLALEAMVPIFAVQGEQEASGTEMLGQVDRQGQHRKIALRHMLPDDRWRIRHMVDAAED